MGTYLLKDLHALGIVGRRIGKSRQKLYSVVILPNPKS
jgi:hypothetical protein